MLTKRVYVKRYNGGLKVDQVTDWTLLGFILLFRKRVQVK